MSWPKHALKTEEELLHLYSKGITKVYLVEPEKEWGGRQIEVIKTETIRTRADASKRPQKRWIYLDNHNWWFWEGEARIPPGSPYDKEKPKDDACVYLFTNYWHAYAHWLKTRREHSS